jgi:hypothetical protein
MPRFDGTGPRGQGPMTGRGEGYCVLELPEPGRPVRGYAGLQGVPVNLEALAARTDQWPSAAVWQARAFGRVGYRGSGRGRGRCFPRRGWWR